MNEAFRTYIETLHPAFERLIQMPPVTIATIAKGAPSECIYLFSESGRHLYVGRTRHLKNRLRQHSIDAAQHNQAVFAFRIAREATGQLKAAYNQEGSRLSLLADPEFAAAFAAAKTRIRSMDLRYVCEVDPLRQALLEIYVAIALRTPYNDFDTH